jgi:predicted HTH domain antitoxin
MPLAPPLPPEEEREFDTWAAQQGEAVHQDARAVYATIAERGPWEALLTVFLKAVSLTQPFINEAARQKLALGQYVLLLLQTMTALYHDNGGRPFTPDELSQRTPLEDAITLYGLHVVSLGIAARIAHVSVSEFIEALGKAGISVFQYTPEEVQAEVDLLTGR